MGEILCKKCNGSGKIQSKFIGLAEPVHPDIIASTGAMGHGLPVALGVALGAKLTGEKRKTYVLMSDGELDCGTTWECAALASHHNVSNLILIIDCNDFQAMGQKKEVLNMEPLAEKWKSFNWNVMEIDGHNYSQIEKALKKAKGNPKKPSVIIARTVKGSGGQTACNIFENKLEWHYKNVDKATFDTAIKLLDQIK